MVLSTITAVSFMAISASAGSTSVNFETEVGMTYCKGELRYSGANYAVVEAYIKEDPTKNNLNIDVTIRAGYKISGVPNAIYISETKSSTLGGIFVKSDAVTNGSFYSANAKVKFTVNGVTSGDIAVGPVYSR